MGSSLTSRMWAPVRSFANGTPCVERYCGAIGFEHLDAHVISACVVMCLHPIEHVVKCAPCNDGIHDTVVSVGEFFLGVAEAHEVVRIVGKPEIHRHVCSGDLPSLRGIGLEDDHLLGGQVGVRADDRAGDIGVLRRDEIGVSAVGRGR